MSKSDRETRKPKVALQPGVARNVLLLRAPVAAIGVAVALLVLGGAWVVRTPAAPQTYRTGLRHFFGITKQ